MNYKIGIAKDPVKRLSILRREVLDELENMNRCNHTELRRLQLCMGNYR